MNSKVPVCLEEPFCFVLTTCCYEKFWENAFYCDLQSRKYLPQLKLFGFTLKQHCFNSEQMVKKILGLFCSKTVLLTVSSQTF